MCCFGLSIKYVAVPQHGPLSLYTKLEGPSITNLVFFFVSNGMAFGYFSRALNFFMVMALGLFVKWPLTPYGHR